MCGLGESLIEEGALKTLVSLVRKGLLAIEEAAAELGISVEEFQKKMNAM